MFLHLIATVAIGLGAAGLLLGLGRLFGGLPRWGAPVAAGLAMAAFLLWSEYSWFDRARAGLAPGARVAEAYPYSSWLQPWTMLVPRVSRFAAVEVADPAPYPDRPAYLRADVLLVARLEGARRLPHLFDCARTRRAALTAGALAAFESGTPPDPEGLDWIVPEGQDALIDAACESGETAEETG